MYSNAPCVRANHVRMCRNLEIPICACGCPRVHTLVCLVSGMKSEPKRYRPWHIRTSESVEAPTANRDLRRQQHCCCRYDGTIRSSRHLPKVIPAFPFMFFHTQAACMELKAKGTEMLSLPHRSPNQRRKNISLALASGLPALQH